MTHLPFILFVFALGASVGSFLNVVVWRLPRGESLVTPPSRCPKCGTRLAWRDNVPVLGWIWLRGKCRYCSEPISARYPIVEFLTGAMFVAYYCLFFIAHVGLSCTPLGQLANFREHWPIYMLVMWLLSALLAESLIDAELFIIEPSVVWLTAAVGVVFHGIHDDRLALGTLSEISGAWGALAFGGAIGWLISGVLWFFGVLPLSFPQGEPILEVEREEVEREMREAKKRGEEVPALPPPYTPNQIRGEMRKEMLFLMPGLVLGAVMVVLTMPGKPLAGAWASAMHYDWFRGVLGSLLGAMAGGFVVYFFRIAGTVALGKVGMGRGDADLMVAVGAVLGAGPAVIAFFLAPFFGICYAIYIRAARGHREMPLGPYLSMATAAVIPLYCPIVAYLSPGLHGIVESVRGWIGS